MRKIVIFSVMLLLFNREGLAQPFPDGFEDDYQDEVLYIHVLENYNFHPFWQYEWEKNALTKHGVRLSFGSISGGKLFSDGRLVINQPLEYGIWFRLHSRWYASRHKDTEENVNLIGFEKRFLEKIGLFILFDPALNKDEIDLQFGVSLTDPSQEQYLRIAYCKDDFVYDDRNELRGESLQEPNGVSWQLRYEIGERWSIFSEGKLSTGFERIYPDPTTSPDMTAHDQKIQNANGKLYYVLGTQSLFEVGGFYYHFSEKKQYYQTEYDCGYSNTIYNLAAKYLFSFRENGRIRLGGHYLVQKANASEFKNFDYNRTEILPFLVYEHLWGKHTVELAYMGTNYRWDYDADNDIEDYSQNGFASKVKLGWTYEFNENAVLQLSISHELSLNRFGGGNGQFMMFF